MHQLELRGKSKNHLIKVKAYHAHEEIHTGHLRSFTSVTGGRLGHTHTHTAGYVSFSPMIVMLVGLDSSVMFLIIHQPSLVLKAGNQQKSSRNPTHWRGQPPVYQVSFATLVLGLLAGGNGPRFVCGFRGKGRVFGLCGSAVVFVRVVPL